jgi:DNA-directed RNA polymerase subunit K/omega
MSPPPLLTRYEVARVIGLRALQLDTGAQPFVHVGDERLRTDASYVAASEIAARALNAMVRRPEGDVYVQHARLPIDLYSLLDIKDGGARSADLSAARAPQSVRLVSSSTLP